MWLATAHDRRHVFVLHVQFRRIRSVAVAEANDVVVANQTLAIASLHPRHAQNQNRLIRASSRPTAAPTATARASQRAEPAGRSSRPFPSSAAAHAVARSRRGRAHCATRPIPSEKFSTRSQPTTAAIHSPKLHHAFHRGTVTPYIPQPSHAGSARIRVSLRIAASAIAAVHSSHQRNSSARTSSTTAKCMSSRITAANSPSSKTARSTTSDEQQTNRPHALHHSPIFSNAFRQRVRTSYWRERIARTIRLEIIRGSIP